MGKVHLKIKYGRDFIPIRVNRHRTMGYFRQKLIRKLGLKAKTFRLVYRNQYLLNKRESENRLVKSYGFRDGDIICVHTY